MLRFNLNYWVTEAQSLKVRAVRAASIAVVGHFASLALRLAATIILTRLLSPDVFGILAIVTTVQVVVALLTDIGLRPAVVRSANGDKPEFQDTAWTLQVIRGGVVFGVAALLAALAFMVQRAGVVPANSTYAESQLPALVLVSSFASVILGFQSINAIVAGRALNLGRLTLIELVAQLGSLLVVIILALMTRSIWAYVIGGLAGAAFNTALSYVWLPGRQARFGWHQEAAAELKRFGKWVFVSSAVGALGLNGDRLLLAALVSPTVLGYFSIANNIAGIPDGVIGRLQGGISLPALSEIWRDQPHRLREIYWRMRWMMDLTGIGLAGFFFAAGPAIIHLMYDIRYASAGHVLQLLSFGLLLSRYGLASNVYLALGRPQYVTLLTAVRLASLFVIVPSLYVLWGVDGALLGVAIQMLPAALLTFYLNRQFKLNSFAYEALLLLAWPLGCLAGWPLSLAYGG
ncbi:MULTISPECIES: oligosaccharide flippase family protein [unclassified Bradyrhizobium]|uniref:oligosaccharide flippase family protein n=1 Tax=unclassified Bradyrhizobium TaxID=2631580 RepID=UPI0028EF99AA|nr:MULTISPECIES: oligosaccharide flippase family protein [unclassified Bradyrhizobium]